MKGNVMLGKIHMAWNRFSTWQKIAVEVMGAVFILVIALLVGVYQFGWQDSIIGSISKVIPLPAASAAGKTINYDSYYEEAHKVGIMTNHVQAQSKTKISQTDINRQAIGSLINDALVQNYASAHKISVSDREVVDARDKIFKEEHGEAAALKILGTQYGVNKAGFSKLIERNLMRQKVEKALRSDSEVQQSSSKRLADVVKALKNKTDFDIVARRYSQDPSSTLIGDKSLVQLKTLPQPVQDQVAKLKDGEVSPSPLNVSGKIYLAKRISSLNNDVQVRIITIDPVNLQEWIRTVQPNSHISIYLPQAK